MLKFILKWFRPKEKEEFIVEEVSAETKLADRLIDSMHESPNDWKLGIAKNDIYNPDMNWVIHFGIYGYVEFNGVCVFAWEDSCRVKKVCIELRHQKTICEGMKL